MFYVAMAGGRAVGVTLEYQRTGHETRNDWKSFGRVEQIAAELTEALGERYLATDAGAWTSPRYDVIKAPVLGMLVSKYFNGDAYPEGEIVKISESFRRIETSTGTVFFRRRQSGSWVEGGTWAMVGGHRNDWNPSF